MTIEINLTAEIQRINERLQAEAPGTDIYHRLLEDLRIAVTMYNSERYRAKYEALEGDDSQCDQPCQVGDPEEPGLPDSPVEAAEENVSAPAADPEPQKAVEADENAEPEAPKPDPATLPKKADVRLALGKARTERGINVTEILQGMGVDNFNDLPPERYPELLEKLG